MMRNLIGSIVLYFLTQGVFADTLNRLEWQAFIKTAEYSQFVNAIAKMRSNTNASDPNSWLYWSDVHENNCPHGVGYFLAWHRGYLYYFERQLQRISGNDNLRVPYWDYYAFPQIPREFTRDIESPLFVNRNNDNIGVALSLNPFSDLVKNFERGASAAFEPSVESLPHNAVHNIIGGWMRTMKSPQDPIFWLHHANIDRLWSAWVAAGGGRKMPDAGAPYWQGKMIYAAGLDIDTVKVRDSVSALRYQYADLTLPTKIPNIAPPRPPEIDVMNLESRTVAPKVLSLGGATGISLNEKSITVAVPLNDLTSNVLFKTVMEGAAPGKITSTLILNGVQITEVGLGGGYFYKVYINLPSGANKEGLDATHFLGTLGAFEVAGLLHHKEMHAEHTGWTKEQGVTVSFELTSENIEAISADPLNLDVSFIRVDGENTVKGEAITIESFEMLVKDKK